MLKIERDKFPNKYDPKTQMYKCPECGWLKEIDDIDTIKLTPDDDGYFNIYCPICEDHKKMRIIKPESWVKRINAELTNANHIANIIKDGSFVGSMSEYKEALKNGLITDGMVVIITTNA